MVKIFYELEYVIFYRFDESDKENVEDRYWVGIFSSKEKISEAINYCLTFDNIDKKNFQIKKYRVVYEKPITILYALYHEYAIINDKGEYIDYSYRFAPKATKKEAIKLRDLMSKKTKYKKMKSRDYTTYPPDGFVIDKVVIDENYFHGLK